MQGALEAAAGDRAPPSSTKRFSSRTRSSSSIRQRASSIFWLSTNSALPDARTLNNINGSSGHHQLRARAVAVRRLTRRSTGRALAAAHAASSTCVLLAGVAFMFYPVMRGYYIGQIQIWIDVLFTAACLSWVTGRPLLAGVLIGLAATIKPQLGLFLVWGVLWRQWPFVWGALASDSRRRSHFARAFRPAQSRRVSARALVHRQPRRDLLSRTSPSTDCSTGWSFRTSITFEFEDQPVRALQRPRGEPHTGGDAISPVHRAEERRDRPRAEAGHLRLRLARDLRHDLVAGRLGASLRHHATAVRDRACRSSRLAAGPASPRPGTALLIASWVLIGNYLAFLDVFKSSWLNVLQSPMLAGGLLLVLLYRHAAGSGAEAASACRTRLKSGPSCHARDDHCPLPSY